jgi:hypothetical protein
MTDRRLSELIDDGSVPEPDTRLSEQDKLNLALSGTEFIVVSVELADNGQFGRYWSVGIQLGGRSTTLGLSEHQGRDAFMQALEKAVAFGPVHGVQLRNKGGSKASPFLILAPATD